MAKELSCDDRLFSMMKQYLTDNEKVANFSQPGQVKFCKVKPELCPRRKSQKVGVPIGLRALQGN